MPDVGKVRARSSVVNGSLRGAKEQRSFKPQAAGSIPAGRTLWNHTPPGALCDVSGHRRQMAAHRQATRWGTSHHHRTRVWFELDVGYRIDKRASSVDPGDAAQIGPGNNLAAGASIRCFARGGPHGRRFRGARLTTELGARTEQELRHAPNPIIRRARANRAETRLCWPAGRSSVGRELALRWNTGRGPQAAESASGADEAWSRGERWSSVGSALRCTGLPGFQSRASTGAQHGTRRNSESTGRIAL
jgi:hypothetical protein